LLLAIQEAVWLIEIMKNLKVVQHSPIIIHEDNQACIEFSNHNVHHAKLKHIQQRYHYTREVIKKEDIKLAYIPTSENSATLWQSLSPLLITFLTFIAF